MKTCWLKRSNSSDCILFMAGWGMAPEPFADLASTCPMDVLMAYDYRILDDADFSVLQPAAAKGRVHLLAWSMGVWGAAYLVQRDPVLSSLLFSSTTAISGTCTPIDDQFGIPVRIFDQMLAKFSPQLLTEFYRSMLDSEEEAGKFLRCRPNRPAEEIRQELLALRTACAGLPAVPDIYSRRLVTRRDRIFPARNQIRAWGRKNCASLALPHFPFYQWDWTTVCSSP